ncbi:hypothetical protein THAOC_31642, partial [Thalassiosira oceanica]
MTDNCKTIHNEVDGAAWTVESPSGFLVEYSRPMYVYVDGTGTDADQNYIQANPSDGFALIYSGLRWQALQLPLFNLEEGRKFWQWQGNNFHAYWWQAYAESIAAISDPTKNDSPVGTDFYWVTDRGEQFGPFGSLEPMQLNKQAGLADDDRCGFCDGREVRDSSFIANSVGDTCEDLKNYAHGIEQVSKNCTDMNYFYQVQCCPDDWHDPCDICNAGLTVDPSTPVPNSGGHTCGSLLDSSRQISDKAVEACVGLQFLEPLCCPADPDSAQSGCSLCPNGMSDDTKDEPVPDPEAQGATCNEIAFYAATSFAPDSEECTWVVQLDSFCCPGGNGAPGSEAETSESAETTGEEAGPEVEAVDEEGAAADSQAASEAESAAITAEAQDEENKVPGETSSKVCGFCGVGGVGPDAAGTEVPGSGGLSCSDLFGYAQTLEDGTGIATPSSWPSRFAAPPAPPRRSSPRVLAGTRRPAKCAVSAVSGASVPTRRGPRCPSRAGSRAPTSSATHITPHLLHEAKWARIANASHLGAPRSALVHQAAAVEPAHVHVLPHPTAASVVVHRDLTSDEAREPLLLADRRLDQTLPAAQLVLLPARLEVVPHLVPDRVAHHDRGPHRQPSRLPDRGRRDLPRGTPCERPDSVVDLRHRLLHPLDALVRPTDGSVVERGTVAQEPAGRVRLEDVDDRHGDQVAESQVRRGRRRRAPADAVRRRRGSGRRVRVRTEDVHPPPDHAVRA